MGIKILKNDCLWMEDEGIKQVHQLYELEGVKDIIGLPDLHPGKTPVGVCVKTENIIYPYIIGSDIGCGMSLFDTQIKLKKFDSDNSVKKLQGSCIKGEYSIGGGNHFIGATRFLLKR